MLDIRYIRQNPDKIREAAVKKRFNFDVDALIALDDRRRQLQQELDGLRHEQKKAGEMIGQLRGKGKKKGSAPAGNTAVADAGADVESQLAETLKRMEEVKARTKILEDEAQKVQQDFEAMMLRVPQVPADEVPVGKDESENVEIRRVGEVPTFDFEPKDHVQLGQSLDIIDIERGVKEAGSRNYILKGDGTLLHMAVLRFTLDTLLAKGFTPMTVPVLVRDALMYGTGYYPGGEEQAYRCERDELSLVGTAEVPLTGYYSDEVLSEDELPKRFCAWSNCFRREAGAAGKDTYGLYRIHIFEKIEQVIVCKADVGTSIEHHQEILRNAEEVLEALQLPYRVVNVCTGDLGQGQVQKFDIETWMPSRKGYGETHSASRFHDFQARRLNLRYRDKDGKLQYCHTLNNTAIASPRILIPLLEIYQNADGSVTIPQVLRPYMGGRERIEPRK